MMKRGFIFCVGVFMIFRLSAQETASEDLLTRASGEFNLGHFVGIPRILTDSATRKMSKEQKVRAFSILSQTYLVLDKPALADSSYLELLRADPEYIASEDKDAIDVVFLSQKFTTRPVFTPHARLGLPFAWSSTIVSNSTSPVPTDVSQFLRPGFQFGVGMDWNITDQWSLGTEGVLSFRSYRKQVSGISDGDDINVIDKQTWVDIPLYVKFSDDKGKWRPFGYAGVALNLLIGSRATIDFVNRSSSQGQESPEAGPDIRVNPSRYLINRSLVIGGGVKYKIGKNYVFADLRYMYGMTNITKPEGVYYRTQGDNPQALVEELTKYQYVFDFLSINSVTISVGYVLPIYQPRMIKRATTKKVAKRLSETTKE